MANWLADLVQALATTELVPAGLHQDSALAQQMQSLNALTQSCEPRWAAQWAELQPAQTLANALDDKVMLLVFGKFNAGKSSLCNFFAERFRQHGQSVRFFRLEAGHTVDAMQCFHEGATETTAHLQGVCLGERLVLLDTPGLHSVTQDNADLTQRFLDSADAVLWLSSSTSPGQVQELDELGLELRRGKPLLPIITRSDCIEEDEVDGQIVKCLRNKTQANRTLQEADVFERALDKLRAMHVDTGLLKTPLSISVHMAKSSEQKDEAMRDAGFERLYGALLDIAKPALAYKQRKPAEVLRHHLQEHVLADLDNRVLPALRHLGQALQSEREALEMRRQRIVQAAWREVIPELPQVLERHALEHDVRAGCAVCVEVASLVGSAFEQQTQHWLQDFTMPPLEPVRIELTADVDYGPAAPDSESHVAWPAMVDFARLHAALDDAVQEAIAERAEQATTLCSEVLRELESSVARRHATLLSLQSQFPPRPGT
ncbi:dynamin family protein [Diaphorobacter caeni]|uniref:dynamin family protein n=1 Tax=Diaphorobacter caeni TaxID=2784387 RepID=UPI001E614C3B|nr:dynamin family protein [Diaphorobacter caeni]